MRATELIEPFKPPNAGGRAGLRPWERSTVLFFGVTIFLSAFLLFQVQLILGKYLLPWFGGTAGMWTASLLFFQTLLLAGYFYAHLLVTRAHARAQVAIHIGLLVAAGVLLGCLWWAWGRPILVSDKWRALIPGDPTLQVLVVLLISVGVPFLVLASTGPLMQAWFHRVQPGGRPYRLYALSNLGSALGLLAYPFLVEPVLNLSTQGRLWVAGFFIFLVFCGVTALLTRRASPGPAACISFKLVRRASKSPAEHSEPPEPEGAGPHPRPNLALLMAWLVIAACASLLMVATTGEICQDVAPLPLLWVAPLFLYLLTFVLCFDREAAYQRSILGPLLIVATALAGYFLASGFRAGGLQQIGVYLIALFAGCMVCHGELARMKPDPRYITTFFLCLSAGGVLGGLFAAIIAPRIFRGYWEYQLALWGCVAVLFLGTLRTAAGVRRRRWTRICCYVGLPLLAILLSMTALLRDRDTVEVTRNFYGVLRVVRDADEQIIELYDGNTVHGAQFTDPDERDTPVLYEQDSGIVRAILQHPRRADPDGGGLRIGMVGLGSGAIAAFAGDGDYVRFYEINPAVVRIARGPRSHFTYLDQSSAAIDVVEGDARISLEEEWRRGGSQQFDVLAIDAFHGNSVPVHLLTREAFGIYLHHLRGPESILAINVTSWHLDLAPVVVRLAREWRMQGALYRGGGDERYSTDWILLTRDPGVAATFDQAAATFDPAAVALDKAAVTFGKVAARPDHAETTALREGPLWTDDYSNLLRLIRWHDSDDE